MNSVSDRNTFAHTKEKVPDEKTSVSVTYFHGIISVQVVYVDIYAGSEVRKGRNNFQVDYVIVYVENVSLEGKEKNLLFL